MYILIHHPFAIFKTLISRRSDVGPGVILVQQVVPKHAACTETARLAIVCLDRILFSKYFLQKLKVITHTNYKHTYLMYILIHPFAIFKTLISRRSDVERRSSSSYM